MRGFRDRDFVRTEEGFFFCVAGPHHPPDRVIAYLKYAPSKRGKWGGGRKRFRRVLRAYTIPSLLETFRLLGKDYPHYLFHSSVYNINMTAVPHECIKRHYKPEKKLAQLHRSRHPDGLQKRLIEFTSFLREKSGVPLRFLGVTGSILLDIHNPKFSDLDVLVYGFKNCLKVKESLMRAYSSSNSAVRRLEGEALKAWCESRAEKHPLTFDEITRISERKWNLGFFDGTPFSIHPVKLEQEVTENYGDRIYYPVEQVVIRAVISENSEGTFLPAVYRVKDVELMHGPQFSDISEVVSYEGLYGDLAEVGETVEVKGKLERVLDKRSNREHHRVLVGSPEGKGDEYVKPA